MKAKQSIGYLVTNTRFSQEAIEYATCMNLKLLSWNYPEAQGLKVLVERTQIHPITCLASLTKKEKQLLLNNKIIHCRQLLENSEILKELRFNHVKISNILSEAEDLISD